MNNQIIAKNVVVDQNGDVMMEHSTLLVTMVCNLKCKLCSAFVPYYNETKHPDVNHVKLCLDRFFAMISYVKKYTICGGEPMTYPYLDEIVNYINEYYSERIGLLEILTNSTIVPSEKLIETIKNYKGMFRVLADDYGVSNSRNADAVEARFLEAGICCERRNYTAENPHCGGWVDFGPLSTRIHDSFEEICKKYEKCAYPQKIGFSFAIDPDGCMFPCGPSRRCHKLGTINNYDNYIDLFDDNLSVSQQKDKLVKILSGKYIDACAYCNGMCEDSERFPPAQQLVIGNC